MIKGLLPDGVFNTLQHVVLEWTIDDQVQQWLEQGIYLGMNVCRYNCQMDRVLPILAVLYLLKLRIRKSIKLIMTNVYLSTKRYRR